MNDPLKILVIRLSSLGDILHTLPAFFDLKNTFPDAKIDWLAGNASSHLLSIVRGIDTIHIFDKSGVRSTWNLIRALRKQRYDYSIDFQGLLKTAFLGFMSGAGTRIGFSRELVREPPAHWFYHRTPVIAAKSLHVLELNRKLTECIGTHPAPAPFAPTVAEKDRACVDSLLEQEGLSDFAILNLGGGWPSKIWEPKRYGELAGRIQKELNLPVVITTGPGEENLYEQLASQFEEKPPIHLKVSFLQLIPLFQKARIIIGGDTGPFHLACALGKAVVGIFGPTSPIRNGPWCDRDEIVANPIPCSFCYKRSCPTDNACMDIAVDEVFTAVIRRLKNADIMQGSVNREKSGGNPPGESRDAEE